MPPGDISYTTFKQNRIEKLVAMNINKGDLLWPIEQKH